jgi:ATP-dependent DNA ligase
MLASGFDQKLVDKIIFPAFCQLKLDGMRFNAIVRNNKVEYRSRNGKELNIPNKLFDATFIELATIYGSDVVFDGELLVADQSGNPLERKTGNGILSKGVKGTMSEKEALCVRATLWDYIPYEDFTKGIYTKENYTTRLANLNFMLVHLNVNKTQLKHYTEVVYTKEVKTQQEATSLFEKFLSEGQEGTILKSKTGIWEDKRSKDQIKFKGELECDLRIVDWEEGTGRNKGRLGALVCESEDGKIRVNVGSGYKDDERDNFSKAMIGQIATVKYNARIKDRSGNVESLFLPTFIELRLDKDIADYSKAIK